MHWILPTGVCPGGPGAPRGTTAADRTVNGIVIGQTAYLIFFLICAESLPVYVTNIPIGLEFKFASNEHWLD